ncbi:protein phosphatase [Anoxybacillus sp. UARK-01]|uniref:Stp1/IreP family PP2C-type Ser/Thr phosphatase n=1 Tax=Anoxybacillus sp. UARK-01 TaxID=1895648 RepID=UPI0009BA42EF|nr:Stp1/IreP family PP2C-type Ser/Thr phosphatase [Anoxybacillus sp. UARK-01]OQM46272.1 protein phosphatase [Anoxybacillus sp. UARK-01]
MKVVFQTDVGKIRPHNEDCGGIFKNKDGHYLAMVADGMGGHRAGDVASEMTISYLKKQWEETENITSPEIAERWLNEQIASINRLLFDHSLRHIECQGMGTTIVSAICTDQFVTIGHIGDSRCYLFNQHGFQQITEDHSLVNELVKTGQISKEDAEHHPRKNVLLRALGTEKSVKLDIKTIEVEERDRLLLCSDGLSNKVSEQSMMDILTSEQSLEEKAQALVHLANEHGGEDNITLVIVEFSSECESR